MFFEKTDPFGMLAFEGFDLGACGSVWDRWIQTWVGRGDKWGVADCGINFGSDHNAKVSVGAAA